MIFWLREVWEDTGRRMVCSLRSVRECQRDGYRMEKDRSTDEFRQILQLVK